MKLYTQEVTDAFSSAQVARHYPRALCHQIDVSSPIWGPRRHNAAGMRCTQRSRHLPPGVIHLSQVKRKLRG